MEIIPLIFLTVEVRTFIQPGSRQGPSSPSDDGCYEARSRECVMQPGNAVLEWLRMPGDLILAFGGVPPSPTSPGAASDPPPGRPSPMPEGLPNGPKSPYNPT